MNGITLRRKICHDLSVSDAQLNRLVLRAPHTYKTYTIPKKSEGVRTIAQPARETKYIQYWLIKNVLHSLPVHESTTAYKSGASIKINAATHSQNAYITKFDFKNFFTSIKYDDLVSHFRNHLPLEYKEDALKDIARISCIQFKTGQALCLSIGAPSSPLLSNSILFDFDSTISEWCKHNHITYTRYADDLTFSTNGHGSSQLIEQKVKEVVKEQAYPSLNLNSKKTVHLSKKHQRRVTGLTITNDGKVSIGRDRKREISALIHKYSLSILSEAQILKLQGLLGFAKDVEPLFVARMRGKYSSELITEILTKRKPD